MTASLPVRIVHMGREGYDLVDAHNWAIATHLCEADALKIMELLNSTQDTPARNPNDFRQYQTFSSATPWHQLHNDAKGTVEIFPADSLNSIALVFISPTHPERGKANAAKITAAVNHFFELLAHLHEVTDRYDALDRRVLGDNYEPNGTVDRARRLLDTIEHEYPPIVKLGGQS